MISIGIGTKVYVVMSGFRYEDDWNVEAVFLTEDEAERYCEDARKNREEGSCQLYECSEITIGEYK